MKHIVYCFCAACLAIALVSCEMETETRNPESSGTDSIEQVSPAPFSEYSKAFKNLVKTEMGVFRGASLGMPVSQVKKLEDTTQLEEQAGDHIDYMLNFQELETAELRYVFNPNERLSKIELNIYPRSQESQDSLFTEFSTYYTSKYGEPSVADSSSRKWENKKEDLYILMQKKGTRKVHDISIVFSSLMRQSALIFEQPLPEDQ